MERIDVTTGLYLQPVFLSLLEYEITRTRRYPTPLTLLHMALCLAAPVEARFRESANLAVAQVLNTRLRETDVIGHYGDNFMILLPATGADGGFVAARRVLQHLKTTAITRQNEHFDLAACIGMAAHPGGADVSANQLLAQAGQALEAARRRGPGTLLWYDEL
jgi:diguanylate cyclase (GGDEF)-like protein